MARFPLVLITSVISLAALIGVLQALILAPYSRQAMIWVPASATSFAVIALGLAYWANAPDTALSIIGLVAAIVLAQSIAATGMVYLLRQSRLSRPAPASKSTVH